MSIIDLYSSIIIAQWSPLVMNTSIGIVKWYHCGVFKWNSQTTLDIGTVKTVDYNLTWFLKSNINVPWYKTYDFYIFIFYCTFLILYHIYPELICTETTCFYTAINVKFNIFWIISWVITGSWKNLVVTDI